MIAEIRPNYPTEWAAMKAVAAKLGIGAADSVSYSSLLCYVHRGRHMKRGPQS
jgi:hypothetical protein